MKVLVCGSRDWTNDYLIHKDLFDVFLFKDNVLIQGCAPGADSIAGAWADAHLLKHNHLKFPADWDTHGKAAGPIRNQQMLDLKPDLVLAYVCKPLAESRGTNDMVTRAKRAGIRVKVTTYYTEEF